MNVGLLFVFVGIFGFVECQIPMYFSCRNFTSKENFSVDQFKGVWYERQRYTSVWDFQSRCNTMEIVAKTDSQMGMKLRSQGKLLNLDLDSILTLEALPARFKIDVSYVSLMFPGTVFVPLSYVVLSTDYQNYAVVAMCQDILFLPASFQSVKIYTRTRPTSDNDWRAIKAIAETIPQLDQSKFQDTDNTNCVPAVN